MISYIGGKARIGKWITPFIPTDIETYVEGFSGMFWVFFNMDLKKYPKLKTVVYNDFNGLNANLFKCAKQYDRLWDELSLYPCQQLGVENTPPEYGEMFKTYQQELFRSDLVIGDEPNFEIAAKYVYVLCQVFSGSKPETSKYTDYKGKYRCKVLIFMDKLKKPKYREHFDKITFVENLDFQEVLTKYDSPTTYFYMDPPIGKLRTTILIMTLTVVTMNDWPMHLKSSRVSSHYLTMISSYFTLGSLRKSTVGSVVLSQRLRRLQRVKNKTWVRNYL